MIKTVNLTTAVTAIDVAGKQNVTVKNIGNNTAYVSVSPDISIGGDDCLSVKAGEIVTLEGVATLKKVGGQFGVHGTVYALASSATTIELISTNSVNFKPAAVDFSGDIADISSLIPTAASAGNQLTDKAYVDSELLGKVDKETGKSLVSDSEIARLATVSNYDDTAVKSDIADIQSVIPAAASPSNQLAVKSDIADIQSGSPYIYMTQAEYESLTEYEPDRFYWVTYPLSNQHLVWCNGECYTNSIYVLSLNYSNRYAVIACDVNGNTSGKSSYFSNIMKIDIIKGATTIGNYAFDGCTALTDISIPEGVTSIGTYAFHNCTSLTDISIPEGVTSIGNYAFDGCTALTDISIPEGVTSIEAAAFYNCTSLTDISIPEGVTIIYEYTFSNCTSLTSVTIPSTVTTIKTMNSNNFPAAAFEKCTQSNLTITINKPPRSISGSPWGATNATIVWTG